jgi:DNA modification methylase
MPARYIETLTVPPGDLQPYPGNAKLHDDDGLDESLDTNGQYRSVVARRLADGALQLLAGHGTTDAIARAEADVRVEVIDADDEVAHRIVLADNAYGARAGYDEVALLALLDTAQAHGGFGGTGYDEDLYSELLDKVGNENPHDWEPEGDPDDVPEVPEVPVTKLGDVWTLGEHRVVCGDSTDPQTWATLLKDKPGPINCLWTDPPYGVSYEGSGGRATQNGGGDRVAIENDAMDEEDLANFIRSAFDQAAAVSAPGAAWYVASPPGPLSIVFASDLHRRGIYRQMLIWVKESFVFGRSDYHYRHEPIFYGWVPGGPHHALDDRTQDSVWEIDRPKRSGEHPTMKPVELVQRALANSTKPGALVCDPFGGSGTTLIAAEATGRRARLIELGPNYCDVIARRYQTLTGTIPLLNGEPVDLMDPETGA